LGVVWGRGVIWFSNVGVVWNGSYASTVVVDGGEEAGKEGLELEEDVRRESEEPEMLSRRFGLEGGRK